jgi:hypothetical protein
VEQWRNHGPAPKTIAGDPDLSNRLEVLENLNIPRQMKNLKKNFPNGRVNLGKWMPAIPMVNSNGHLQAPVLKIGKPWNYHPSGRTRD